jgi:sporulation protein YlmC with PRC-barrel domain
MPMSALEETRDFTFQDVRDFPVMNTTGHRVGAVEEIYVDPNTREPAFALLNFDRFNNLEKVLNWKFDVKQLLVVWDDLILGDDYVQTRWTESHLRPETLEEQRRNLGDRGMATEFTEELEEEETTATGFGPDRRPGL